MIISELYNSSITRLGVFDSGLGGLTVLNELLKTHPTLDYVYFGDTAHVPYGSRTAEDVVSLVTSIARYLVEEGCQGLILACNTSSALALPTLRASVDVPMVGVIGTASRETARICLNKVAVLANPLTAASGVYKSTIHHECGSQKRESLPEVYEIGCPDLVPIVENDRLYTEESAAILQGYADRLEALEVDTLVFGCTHYPLLLPVLRPMLAKSLRIVDPAELIPEYLHPTASGGGTASFRVSGETGGFDQEASKILRRPVKSEQVTLRRSCEIV